jgi:SAM-dependent methyltransferase
LVAVLRRSTDFFETEADVLEVAPMRGLQAMWLKQPGIRYRSFDIGRFAMERADITDMPYKDASVDWFFCYHVLEHIPDENKAVSEIHRVLTSSGTLVVQVPVDWSVPVSYEYDLPDPREVGHVRRYGKDFESRLARMGFDVMAGSVRDLCSDVEIEEYGFDLDPVYLATPVGK